MHNTKADSLAKLASLPSLELSRTIPIEYLQVLSIHDKELLTVTAEQNGG